MFVLTYDGKSIIHSISIDIEPWEDGYAIVDSSRGDSGKFQLSEVFQTLEEAKIHLYNIAMKNNVVIFGTQLN